MHYKNYTFLAFEIRASQYWNFRLSVVKFSSEINGQGRTSFQEN